MFDHPYGGKPLLLYLIRISLLQHASIASLPIPLHLGPVSLSLFSFYPLTGHLVFLRLNKPSSLLPCDKSWITLLVFHWTCSNLSMPFLCGREQNWIKYSRYNLTSVEQRGSFTSLELLVALLCYKDSIHSTQLNNLYIGSFSLALSIYSVLSMWLFHPRWRTLHVTPLNFRGFLLLYFSILVKLF